MCGEYVAPKSTRAPLTIPVFADPVVEVKAKRPSIKASKPKAIKVKAASVKPSPAKTVKRAGLAKGERSKDPSARGKKVVIAPKVGASKGTLSNPKVKRIALSPEQRRLRRNEQARTRRAAKKNAGVVAR
jgi:hypothetical protein